MRLLQVDENREFSLTDDLINNIPPYAILSHTWGADHEEVNFKDLIKGPRKSKVGYKKLRFCAEQAARDGLQYIWVDTCCIDKSSSAELSEAINSMFHWYRNADKCYAYLSDVSTGGPVENGNFLEPTWMQDFQRGVDSTREFLAHYFSGPHPRTDFQRKAIAVLVSPSTVDVLWYWTI
jgi:hypothetical protein